jgi:hypothetical protein
MNNELALYYKLSSLSSDLKSEVESYIEFLLSKKQKISNKAQKPVFGCAKGKIKMSKDFDAPLDDFKGYI